MATTTEVDSVSVAPKVRKPKAVVVRLGAMPALPLSKKEERRKKYVGSYAGIPKWTGNVRPVTPAVAAVVLDAVEDRWAPNDFANTWTLFFKVAVRYLKGDGVREIAEKLDRPVGVVGQKVDKLIKCLGLDRIADLRVAVRGLNNRRAAEVVDADLQVWNYGAVQQAEQGKPASLFMAVAVLTLRGANVTQTAEALNCAAADVEFHRGELLATLPKTSGQDYAALVERIQRSDRDDATIKRIVRYFLKGDGYATTPEVKGCAA